MPSPWAAQGLLDGPFPNLRRYFSAHLIYDLLPLPRIACHRIASPTASATATASGSATDAACPGYRGWWIDLPQHGDYH